MEVFYVPTVDDHNQILLINYVWKQHRQVAKNWPLKESQKVDLL